MNRTLVDRRAESMMRTETRGAAVAAIAAILGLLMFSAAVPTVSTIEPLTISVVVEPQAVDYPGGNEPGTTGQRQADFGIVRYEAEWQVLFAWMGAGAAGVLAATILRYRRLPTFRRSPERLETRLVLRAVPAAAIAVVPRLLEGPIRDAFGLRIPETAGYLVTITGPWDGAVTLVLFTALASVSWVGAWVVMRSVVRAWWPDEAPVRLVPRVAPGATAPRGTAGSAVN